MENIREDFIKEMIAQDIPNTDLQGICEAQELINGWSADELLDEIRERKANRKTPIVYPVITEEKIADILFDMTNSVNDIKEFHKHNGCGDLDYYDGYEVQQDPYDDESYEMGFLAGLRSTLRTLNITTHYNDKEETFYVSK